MKAKKLIAGALSLCIIGSNFIGMNVSAADIFASGKCGENASWTLDSDGLLTISGTGETYDYLWRGIGVTGDNITVEWKGDPVPWFEHRSDITKIIISNGIEHLGDTVFIGCDNAETVEFPDTLLSIGDHTFYQCTSLTEISLPDSVVELGFDAFNHCTSLTSVRLSQNLQRMSSAGFDCCHSLTEIIIPQSVMEISTFAVTGESLERVFILSKDCEIADYSYVFKNDDLYLGTIYGFRGSTAQAYAEKYDIKFIPIQLGDIDLDGAVNALDASLALTEYAAAATGKASGFGILENYCADTDADGNINALDASYILSYYSYTATGGEDTFEEYMK